MQDTQSEQNSSRYISAQNFKAMSEIEWIIIRLPYRLSRCIDATEM